MVKRNCQISQKTNPQKNLAFDTGINFHTFYILHCERDIFRVLETKKQTNYKLLADANEVI